MAKINFTRGKGGFDLLPEGTYDFTIKSVKQGTAKTSGNAQLEVDLEVVDGNHAGASHREWYSLSPKAGWKIAALLEAAGIDAVDTGQVNEESDPVLEADPDELVGRFIRGTISHEKYEKTGKTNARLNKEEPSPFTPAKAQPAAPAQAAPAQPSAAGAPAQVRRPRPAPAS